MNDRMAEMRAQRAVNAKAREEVRRIRQDCARDLNYNRSASTRHKLQRELDDAYARIEFLESVVADAGISIDEDGAAPAQTGRRRPGRPPYDERRLQVGAVLRSYSTAGLNFLRQNEDIVGPLPHPRTIDRHFRDDISENTMFVCSHIDALPESSRC